MIDKRWQRQTPGDKKKQRNNSNEGKIGRAKEKKRGGIIRQQHKDKPRPWGRIWEGWSGTSLANDCQRGKSCACIGLLRPRGHRRMARLSGFPRHSLPHSSPKDKQTGKTGVFLSSVPSSSSFLSSLSHASSYKRGSPSYLPFSIHQRMSVTVPPFHNSTEDIWSDLHNVVLPIYKPSFFLMTNYTNSFT